MVQPAIITCFVIASVVGFTFGFHHHQHQHLISQDLLDPSTKNLRVDEKSQVQDHRNYSISRRGILPTPKQIFNTVRETIEEHLSFDKILNKQLAVLDAFLEKSKLLPVGLRIPRISLLPDLGVLRQLFNSGRQNARSTAVCHACRVGFALFLAKARTGIAFRELQKTAILGCKAFKIASAEVCTGMVELYAPTLQFIGKERSELTPDGFCATVLQSYGCIAIDRDQHGWKAGVEGGDLIEIDDRDPIIPESLPTLKILHLADIHVDPHYRIGSNAVCESELCCRGPEVTSNFENGAGYFGDLRKCDLPYHTFELALEHIAKVHSDVDLIYMTGDLVPHDGWTTDTSTNVQILKNVSALIQAYFPDTRVVPVIGNHETHPLNMFPPSSAPSAYSIKWLYEAAGEAWANWIPQESMATFLKAGYYHAEISPGFRVIGMNTNFCYGFNFWQMYNFNDPEHQLHWLAKVLRKSRAAGEKVHIVGHLPPGQEECSAVWSRNFYEIIYRFRDVVRSQFYGHTHYDEFQLYYHKEKKEVPINTIWMGPSLSPFINLNPSYKVYAVDGARGGRASTWNVIDFETWIFNLKQANVNPDSLSEPQWFRLYRASEAYDLPDVLPGSMNRLVERLSTNESWFNLYYRHYFKDTPESLIEKCDQACKKRLLCNIVSPHFDAQSECMEIETEVDGVVLPKRVFEKIRTAVLSPLSQTARKVLSVFGLG